MPFGDKNSKPFTEKGCTRNTQKTNTKKLVPAKANIKLQKTGFIAFYDFQPGNAAALSYNYGTGHGGGRQWRHKGMGGSPRVIPSRG